jgi:hemolysin activation/secretion protein
VTALRLRIWTGQVSRVATIADGERFGGLSVDERTNRPEHAWIRERSPVRPGGPRGLLSVTALEDYAAEISRHPGRRMDVEVAPGPRAGTTAVNLRITESKPWYAYAQYSNTGTSSTTVNRERFGYTHNQLLGRDDILQLDYTTGDFDEVHAVSAAATASSTRAKRASRPRTSMARTPTRASRSHGSSSSVTSCSSTPRSARAGSTSPSRTARWWARSSRPTSTTPCRTSICAWRATPLRRP